MASTYINLPFEEVTGPIEVIVDSVVTVNQGTTPWTVGGTVTTVPSGTQDVNLVSTITVPVSGPLTDTELRASPVPISGAVTAAQSGTWNINNISGTVSLPTNAATSIKQSDGSQKTQIVDGGNTTVGPVQSLSGTNYLPVALAASATPGSAVVARSVQVAGSDGTNARTLATDTLGNTQIVGNVASGVADSGNPVRGAAKFSTTMPTFTNGQRAGLQSNMFGELAVVTRNKYLNITGATTTTVKSGPGRLNAIVMNGGTSSTRITIYDNTTATGTLIATINPANSGPFYLQYNAEFSTGLTIVTIVSSTDITVLYQ